MSWPTERLDELCDIQIGRTPSRADNRFWDGGTHPWASIADISRDRDLTTTKECITDQALSATKIKVVPEGTVLMSFKLSIGKVAIARIDTCTNEAIAALSVKSPKSLDRDYLARALESLNFDDAGDRAAKGKTLNKKSLAKLEIPLPPLGEQKRIAAILDKADELRRKRQCAIDRLNQLGHAIFHEMFGDPNDATNGNPRVSLGNILKVSSGGGLTASEQNGGDVPVYGGNGINGWHDKANVDAGTIVIGRVGVYCGAVHVVDRPAWVTDNALVVKMKKPVNRTYLAVALKIANLNQYAGRSAQPLVSGKRIYPIEILIPSEAEQETFEKRLSSTEGLRSSLDTGQRKFDALFQSLQHSAFKGEV